MIGQMSECVNKQTCWCCRSI